MSSTDHFMPSSPFIGIQPPKDIRQRDPRNVVYGFPLTREWLQHRYHREVELASLGRTPVESEDVYFIDFTRYLARQCQLIHPVKCKATMVETAGHEHGRRALFLIVGYPGQRPSLETLEKLIDKLADYGVIEEPGWYPKI